MRLMCQIVSHRLTKNEETRKKVAIQLLRHNNIIRTFGMRKGTTGKPNEHRKYFINYGSHRISNKGERV